MRLKFIHYLFLPSVIILLWWIVAMPIFVFPNSDVLKSNVYSNIIPIAIVVIGEAFLLIDLGYLIYKREYKNAIALILGVPIAILLGYISVILMFAFGGVMVN